MRILFIAPRFHTNQYPLVKALLAHEHEVRFHVLNVGRSESHDSVTPQVIQTSRLSDFFQRRSNPEGSADHRAKYAFPSLQYYRNQLRQWRPDVIIVRDPSRRSSLVATLAARLEGVRILLYTQGPVHARTSRLVHSLRTVGAALTRGVWISPVLGDAETLPSAHPAMHYIPFTADPSLRPKTSWYAQDYINILGIGKFVPRKNHLLLVDAFHRLGQSNKIRLTLVGECSSDEHRYELEKVRARILQLGLDDRIRIRTNVPFHGMEQVYLEHDLFVLPSRNESAAVSILEAMTHGLPAVCSTTNGTRHDVIPGLNGGIFESDNLDSLTELLQDLVHDRDRLRRMGVAARAEALAHHHPDIVVRAIENVAAALPGNPPISPHRSAQRLDQDARRG